MQVCEGMPGVLTPKLLQPVPNAQCNQNVRFNPRIFKLLTPCPLALHIPFGAEVLNNPKYANLSMHEYVMHGLAGQSWTELNRGFPQRFQRTSPCSPRSLRPKWPNASGSQQQAEPTLPSSAAASVPTAKAMGGRSEAD